MRTLETPMLRTGSKVLALLLAGCGGGAAPGPFADPPDGPVYVEEIHRAYAQLGMVTGEGDVSGRPERAPCGSCHHVAGLADRAVAEEAGVHAGITLEHGDNTCRTCHLPPDFQRFGLATGVSVGYPDVMRLCAQCHAGQRADYEAGLHGGMSGYWDLRSGPRLRNHCTDCHGPHAPAYPLLEPAPRPLPRFLAPKAAGHE